MAGSDVYKSQLSFIKHKQTNEIYIPDTGKGRNIVSSQVGRMNPHCEK